MKKYKLTNEEKDIINEFEQASIPFVFKSGEYNTFIQYFEFIIFEVCYILLHGKEISKFDYNMVMSDIVYNDNNINDDPHKIVIEHLDDYALYYFKLYLKVKDIVKKYYIEE